MRRFFALMLLFLPAAALGQTSTAMFHGNPLHTGVYQSDVQHWHLLWRFHTGSMVRSSAAVVDGTVYIGSNDHHLYALHAKTGKLRWAFAAHGPVASSPAVVDGRVYFIDGSNVIYALNAATGKMLWKTRTGPNLPVVGGWDFYDSSPTVVGGVVYVGSGDGSLYALNARTGRQEWSFHTHGRVHTSPAVDGNVIVFGSMDGALYAVTRNGHPLWKFQTNASLPFPMTGVFIGSPTIALDLGLVFAGCRDGHLYALDLKTGKLRWTLGEHGSWVVSTPAYAHGIVYTSTSDTRMLQAIDAKTGRILWQYQGSGYEFASPIVTPHHVIGAFWSAVLLEVRKSDGKAVNGNGGEGPVISSPVVANGVVYIGCDDGYVYAFG